MRARYPRLLRPRPRRRSPLLRKPLQVRGRVAPACTLSLDGSIGRSRKLSEPDPSGYVPEHQEQGTAFETHNGRSASTAGTAPNGPYPPFAISADSTLSRVDRSHLIELPFRVVISL